jgi:hypothetical protein
VIWNSIWVQGTDWVVNWRTILKGRIVFLLAGSLEYREALGNELLRRLQALSFSGVLFSDV